MKYTTVYVGMDVHKESFTLACYTNEKEEAEYVQRTEAHYSKVISYLEAMRFHYGDEVTFICGYEAGCLGYTLYHQLTNHHVRCVIIAPTSMPVQQGKKKVKTDRRDARKIAKCLAHHEYSAVHIPTAKDEGTKEYLRMRDDHKLALKKIKQQILSFCLRHGYSYTGGSQNWTKTHLKWLRELKPGGMYQEILEEYLLTYNNLVDKLERMDKRIEEMAAGEEYSEAVRKLSCFPGIKTQAALSLITETGDFKRFATAEQYASYLGLVPGENSSGEEEIKLGITKAGNRHLRMLLVEAAQHYGRGHIGHKSKELKKRQEGNAPEVIAYADKANERLHRRYYRLVLAKNKRSNVAKVAVARELACFIWGMMTGNVS